MGKKNILIAGGGTGGHIYPGIAIARAIAAKSDQYEFHFIGTPDGLETKIVPREGFPLHLIPIGKLNTGGGVVGKIKTLLQMPVAFFAALKFYLQLRPVYVFGVGGYASGPMVLLSAFFRTKTAIWEPNAYPGLTNRWLSYVVDTAFVVFQEAKELLRAKEKLVLGLPIRKELDELAVIAQNRDSELPIQKIKSSPSKKHLLIFGGSQGARTVNSRLKEIFLSNPSWLNDYQVIHQTGVHDFAELSKAYEGLSDVEAIEYLHGMDKYYQWADVVICRSGAGTVAEIAAARKKAIFIPLPWAADDHQRKNAEALANIGSAWIILQKDLNAQSLQNSLEQIEQFNQSEAKLQQWRKGLENFHIPNAADKVADEIIKEIEK